ncbi:butyrophilin subfamily 1 member A1-like [Paralichthys olivaceus]|uniref:butyrophilin subfamily 1 member A1-like n=1 Tax=Paralichthys olivaceus TaxID=8255 RepID=UPI0037522E37
MFHRLLLVSALLPCCAGSGESSVHGPPEGADGPEKVWAFAGGAVVLPCTFNLTDGGDVPTVEWSNELLQPNVVFLYRDGCETHEMKNPDFEYRTSFIWKELKNGNISLRISNLKLSDAGQYRCKRLWKNGRRDSTTVQLFVFSEPKHSEVFNGAAGATLQCEVSYWQLEPEIIFLDHQGNEILAEDPRRDDDTRGFFTVRRRATLQTANSSVTCRVQLLQLHMHKDKNILTPVACSTSCSLTSCFVAGGAILFVLFTGVIIWKKCSPAVTRQVTDENTDNDLSERQSLMLYTDPVTNHMLDQQSQRPVLMSDLGHELSSVVCQQDRPTSSRPSRSSQTVPHCSTAANNIPAQSKCPKPGIQRQNSAPGSARLVQRPRRNFSSPELPCLLSCSESKPHVDVSRLQCRHPAVLPPSSRSNKSDAYVKL